jgi:hypothetical protein
MLLVQMRRQLERWSAVAALFSQQSSRPWWLECLGGPPRDNLHHFHY